MQILSAVLVKCFLVISKERAFPTHLPHLPSCVSCGLMHHQPTEGVKHELTVSKITSSRKICDMKTSNGRTVMKKYHKNYQLLLFSSTELNTILRLMFLSYSVFVMGLCGRVLVAGVGCRGGFCEKLQEASPMSDRASDSRL